MEMATQGTSMFAHKSTSTFIWDTESFGNCYLRSVSGTLDLQVYLLVTTKETE